jgi:hypothetical protein
MKDERDGPIHPEEHPMLPWPVKMGLKEARHKRELDELRRQLVVAKNGGPMFKKVLWYAFWGWTVYATLAYFGFLEMAQPAINGLIEAFGEISNLVHF